MIEHNRKKQSLRISAKGNSSMQSPQTLHGAVTIQSIILFSFRRYESIHIAKDLILLYSAVVTLSMKLRACFLQDTASIHAT